MPEPTPADAGHDATSTAAPGPSPEPSEDGRARLKRALFKPGPGQWMVAVLMALVGLAAVLVMRVTSESDPYANMRQDALVNVLEGISGTTERARRELTTLEETKRQLQQDATSEEAAREQARERISTLNILAGQVAVTGPGIRATVDVPDQTNVYAPILNMIQELRTAGAEAIEINGKVRVVAQTAFSSDAEGLVVNGVRLKAPYVVAAIGDATKLTNALTFRDGPKAEIEGENFKGSLAYLEQNHLEIRSLAPRPGSGSSDEASTQ